MKPLIREVFLLIARVDMGVDMDYFQQKKGLKKNAESLLLVMVTPTGFEPVLPA